MKRLLSLAAAASIVTLAAGCGQSRGPDGLTQDERERLNEIAVQQDNQVIDASPDSLVANDEWMAAETGDAAAANAGAANGAAPASNAAAAPAGNAQ